MDESADRLPRFAKRWLIFIARTAVCAHQVALHKAAYSMALAWYAMAVMGKRGT
ncbi:MAG: hypothetical protein NTW32_14700 [Chloroflexi bacterium]|nr:hypothetical protein [Chloroflexota bacterium]